MVVRSYTIYLVDIKGMTTIIVCITN